MRRLAIASCLAAALTAGGARADSVGDVRTGNAAFGDGRYEAAVQAFTRAILAGDLQPDGLAVTFNNRGVAFSELGDYDRAIGDYGQALALMPGDATAIKNLRIAHIRRAAAASRVGDRTAALADYDRAIELDPAHPLAYLRRGQLALERGDREAAIADLTKAKERDPTNPDIAAQLVDALRADAVAATPAEAAPLPPPERAPPPVPQAPPAAATTAGAAENDYSIEPPVGGPPRPAPSTAVAPRTGPVPPAADGVGRTYRALQDVNVRRGPDNGQPRVGTIGRGATVRVVGERLGWMEVRLAGGGRGFVYRRWLQAVEASGAATPRGATGGAPEPARQ